MFAYFRKRKAKKAFLKRYISKYVHNSELYLYDTDCLNWVLFKNSDTALIKQYVPEWTQYDPMWVYDVEAEHTIPEYFFYLEPKSLTEEEFNSAYDSSYIPSVLPVEDPE